MATIIFDDGKKRLNGGYVESVPTVSGATGSLTPSQTAQIAKIAVLDANQIDQFVIGGANGKTLIAEQKDSTTIPLDLTPMLKAGLISFDDVTTLIGSGDVQGVIKLLNDRLKVLEQNLDLIRKTLTITNPSTDSCVFLKEIYLATVFLGEEVYTEYTISNDYKTLFFGSSVVGDVFNINVLVK